MGIALAVAGLACLLAAAKRAPPFAGTNIEAGLETLTKGNGRVEARQLRHRFDAVIGCFQQRGYAADAPYPAIRRRKCPSP